MVALFVVIGMAIVSRFRGVVDAIPTPADLAAVFEPEPYEEIGPVVISSIRDLSNLTTVETRAVHDRGQGQRPGLAVMGTGRQSPAVRGGQDRCRHRPQSGDRA